MNKIRKTRKLTCIITGRVLTATRDYYERKIKKAGSEDNLHMTYVCKEAKDLLFKGYTPAKIREMLSIDDDSLSSVSQELVNEILASSNKSKYRRVNTFNNMSSVINVRTDPLVKKLIENLKNESA